MDCIITAKLTLDAPPDQVRALRQPHLAYRAALNFVSRYAVEHGTMSNQIGLQEATSLEVRAKCGLPAQMACHVPRQVGATDKTLWTKVTAPTAAGKTKKRSRGVDQVPKYVAPSLTSNYQRDDRFTTGRQVSVLTLQGRVILPSLHRRCAPGAPYPAGRPQRRRQALV
jgi:putative transposase